jgi:hypothetical protein
MKMLSKYLQGRRLFKECVEALGANGSILADEETRMLLSSFSGKAPFYEGGSRIDWTKVKYKVDIDSPEQIKSSLKELLGKDFNQTVYLFWNDASLPAIKTDLDSIIKSYDDIISVGFETWMYNPEEGYVVENYYLGEIHAGII